MKIPCTTLARPLASSHRIVLAMASLGIMAGCASGGGQRTYVAPTQETVVAIAEEIATSPGQVIYAENRSSVPIIVYSVTLRDCENVKAQCAVRPMNLKLDPGSRGLLARVEAANPQRSFGFHYTFGWRADSTTSAALSALAATGDTTSKLRLDAMRRAQAREHNQVGAQDVDLIPSELATLAPRAASLRAVPESLVINVGAHVPMDTLRVLLIGTNGEILGRIRAIQWRLAPGAVSIVQPDTLVGRASGRGSLQLKLQDAVLPERTALHNLFQVPIVVK